MFCSECGKQVADDAKFCGECGAVQSNVEQTPEIKVEQVISKTLATSNAVQRSGNNKFVGYVIGAIFVFLIGFIAVSTLFSNSSVLQAVKIGGLLHAGSFDITIKNASVSEILKTGNELADPKPQQGSQFLVIDGDYKNTDSTTHTLSSGYVAVDVDGKKLIYNKAELILNDGWGLIFEKVGPLITKSTKLVYRIPLNLKGKVYFYPFNNHDDVFEIGVIENGKLQQEQTVENTSEAKSENEKNQIGNNSPEETFEKIDSMALAFKYVSNPFEVRKSLGKKMETEIFTENFIDEGSTAMVIDANDGFYCRMSGAEYGQHNQRGVMVVRGILAESNGRLGLDNCTFVSNTSGIAGAPAAADAPAASAADVN